MKSYLVGFFLGFTVCFSAFAEDLLIDDIRIVGLQRVSAGTIFSAIDIKANSEVTEVEIQKAIRDVFATGYFDDVSIGRDANTLIIDVVERPVISVVVLEGNKVIPKEGLLEALKSIGLAEGEVFKQSALDSISKELSAQYSALGRYSAEIETETREFSQNQIVVGVRINEGHVAKIKHINIVGNTQFSEKKLRDLFSLNTTGTWSWITGSDKYAKEKLAGDLEKLKSYYLDRGYLKFTVTSTQVSLSPDKETVFITVNVSEGSQFFVGSIDIAGDPILPEDELRELIGIAEGDSFSQLLVTRTEDAIQRRLGDEGYSAAAVSGIPELNEEGKTVKLSFYIKPGEISYVRRITFVGNKTTADHVLRREMRQLEGAPVSSKKLEQSRARLQRLGLFGEVNLTTRQVPGTTDQIDVEFSVTEQPTASINLSLGYSGDNGISLGAGLQHNNWLGSGNTFGFNVQNSDTETSYNLNFRNPYYTKDGVSRGIRLFYQERDFEDISISNYATDTAGLKVTFGYPISETARLSFGLGFENINVEPGTTTAQEIQSTPTLRDGVNNAFVSTEFYENNILEAIGDPDNSISENIDIADTNNNGLLDEQDNLPSDTNDDALFVNTSDPTQSGEASAPVDSGYGTITSDPSLFNTEPTGFLDKYGDSFNVFTVDFGLSSSSFDRGVFPTKGISQRLNFELAVPGGDLEYYKLTYRGDVYIPVTKSSSFRFRGRLGYADSYGDIDEFPFFENFFAGGVGSVRGFESSSLGPKSTPSNAYVAVPVIRDDRGDSVEYVYVQNDDSTLLSVADDDLDSFGGNILVELGVELAFPFPFISNSDKLRSVFFIDSGNVFSNNCGPLQENCDNVDLSKLSVSAGIAFQWLSPVGPMSFNFSKPLVEQPFDKTESFQFSLGRSF
ncbi:MAG: outer membrane protein assembly factor BamA [Cellvibrionaceae bacterium]